MNVDELARLLVIVILTVSTTAIGAGIYSLVSGSYIRYSQKRIEHYAQLHRIREELKRGRQR